MAMRRKLKQPEDHRRTLVARHGLAAIAAVAAEAAVSYPLDTLKSLKQVSANAGKIAGQHVVVDAKKGLDVATLASGIRSTVGVSGFYGGLGWHLLGRLPALGTRFGVYELCCAFTTDGRASREVSISEAFMAGLCAGSVEAFVATPFDILKLRGQVAAVTVPATGATALNPKPIWKQIEQSLVGLPHAHPKMVPAIRNYAWLENGTGQPPLIKDVSGLKRLTGVEGVTVLWRGLRPGIFRDAPYAGVFFGSWQFLYELMLEWKALDMETKPSSLEDVPPLKPWQLSVSAGIAASGAAVVSHALDTAKTRSQATVIPKHIAMERKLLKWVKPGSWLQRTAGILPFDQPMLWRALKIRAFQHGLAATALVGTYETAMQYFMRHDRR